MFIILSSRNFWRGSMKKLVVFYSLDGNTRLIAEKIAETVSADILELKPVNEITRNNFLKIFAGGKQAILKAEPELMPFVVEPENYEIIFFGTPVWAWTYSPALRTYFRDHKPVGKKVALFYCHGGGPRNFLEKFEEAVEGNELLGSIEFKDPVKNEKDKDSVRAIEWAEGILKKAGIIIEK